MTISERRRNKAYEDAAGYDWLAGNLITEATAVSQDSGLAITACERMRARKIYHRLAELLAEAGHSINPHRPGHAVVLNKKAGGAIEVNLSYEGCVGDPGDSAVIAVAYLLKGAALAMTAMGWGARIAGDRYSLQFTNLEELASVVDAVTPDREKEIGASPA